MNINLMIADGGYAEDGDTLQSSIDEHREIMQGAGFTIVGPAVLLPEMDPAYPGSYRVWWPVDSDTTDGASWVYIDPDGVAVFRAALPTADEMDIWS